MFLAIDIGNTSISIGYFRKNVLQGSFSITTAFAASDKAGLSLLKLLEEHLGKGFEIGGIGISSVVPLFTDKFVSSVEKYLKIKPKILSPDLDLGFRILYDDPGQLGTDRLADVIAARKLYGFPALVIDLGTATKYEVIDNEGNYRGGLIAPGVWTAASALFERGARLVPVLLEKPIKLIGTNTTEALRAGIYYGFLGQMTYLVGRLRKEMGSPDAKVVATGGYAELFREDSKLFDVVDPGLTLKGIEIALNR